MDVFEYYLKRNQDDNWVKEYQSTSGKKSGKIFFFTNVNFRGIKSFVDIFPKFNEYNDVPREEWLKYEGNGEQKAKQWTVRMQQSKLFMLNNGRYSLTAKGVAFSHFVDCVNRGIFNAINEWILIYYFILNSYFDLTPNYIIKRCVNIVDELKRNGIDKDCFIKSLENFICDYFNEKIDIDSLFSYDAFWYLTFFNEQDFLFLYKKSGVNEKKNLSDYVATERKKIDSVDCLGHKYKNSGQYTLAMLADDALILYVTTEILARENVDAIIFADNLAAILEKFNSSRKVITDFVTNHFDVFETIYNESILGKTIIDESDVSDEEDDEDEDVENIPAFEKQDDTTTTTRKILRETSAILKRMAKDRVNFKCELEPLNSCRYFTSKESKKNYLEVHHLIPFEFTNEFQNSIEVLENYIVLCPHCHRLLHYGMDRERKSALTYLYNLRNEALRTHGVDISLEILLKYYGIEN